MTRFEVRERELASGHTEFLVVDAEDDLRPVAEFGDRDAAEAHAAKLEDGPLDWDEQEAWKDDWDDEDAPGDA